MMMTKDSYKLGRGRLIFDHDAMPSRPLGSFDVERSGTFTIRMEPFQMANVARWFDRDGVREMIGYDPQRLLPAPGSDPSWFLRDLRQIMSDTPYFMENIFKPSDFHPNEIIDFEAAGTGRFHGKVTNFRDLYDDVPRWGEQRHPLDDIAAFREEVWRHKRAVIVVGPDWSNLEARIMAASRIPGVVATTIDFHAAQGEILYNRAVTDAMLSCYLKPAPKAKATKQNGRPAGYLKHDPTK